MRKQLVDALKSEINQDPEAYADVTRLRGVARRLVDEWRVAGTLLRRCSDNGCPGHGNGADCSVASVD